MKDLCFNCPYNKGLELGNGCGNDTCIQENVLFEKDEEKERCTNFMEENLNNMYEGYSKILEELEEENKQLKQQLAEKEKEIEYQENMKILAVANQNKKAIEQLEKVKDWCKEYRTIDEFGVFTINVDDVLNTEDNLLNFIDNQIKQLKEKQNG